MTDAATAPPPTPPRKKTRRLSLRLNDIQDSYVRGRAAGLRVTKSAYLRYLVDRDRAGLAGYLANEARMEEQRRSFAYGNVKLANDRVNWADVDRLARVCGWKK